MAKGAIFMMMVLFFLSIFFLFQIKSNVREMEKSLIRTKVLVDTTRKEVHILEAEWSYLNRPERLKKLALVYLSSSIISANQVTSELNDLK